MQRKITSVQATLTRQCHGCGIEIPYRGYGHPPKWCTDCKRKANAKAVKAAYIRRRDRLRGKAPAIEKRCIRCELVKSQGEFGRATANSDGLQSWCKQCASEYQKANLEAGQRRLRRWRARNPDAHNRYLRKARRDAIEHYALTDPPSCACCGESEQAFLVIDHVDGGGGAERRIYGSRLFVHLRRQHYPSGYQVLCWNCNAAKQYQGMCPHERARLCLTSP